jgi:hypothetical protein
VLIDRGYDRAGPVAGRPRRPRRGPDDAAAPRSTGGLRNHDVRRLGHGVTRRGAGRNVPDMQTIVVVVLPERAD